MNAIALVHAHATPSALIDRDVLLEALNLVSAVAPKRETIPILANVLITHSSEMERCVSIRTTDLDMQIEVLARANVSEEFATTVPAQMLRELVKKTPDAEKLRASLELLEAPPKRRPVLDGDGEPIEDEEGMPRYEDERRNSFVSDRLLVRLGRASYQLASRPPEDFPSMAPFSADPIHFKISGSALWNGFDSVLAGMSTEETRYYLNGAFLHLTSYGTLATTTTDGHRLFRQDVCPVDGLPKDIPDIIIPSAAVRLLHQLWRGKACPADLEIYLDASRFAVNWGPVSFMTKTIDGNFPDYGRVMPTGNDKVAVVRSGKMMKAIAAVTAMSPERGRAVKCSFEKGKLTLAVNNPDAGWASIDLECSYDGDPLDIGFNASYLADIVTRAAPDHGNIEIRLDSASSPTLFFGSVEGWTGVLMPTRV